MLIQPDLTTLDHAKQWLDITGLRIASIAQSAQPTLVTLVTEPGTPLLNGATYSFDGIAGMTQLNDTSWPITIVDPKSFTIPVDTFMFSPYTGLGYVGLADPIIARLIKAVSAYIRQYLNRDITAQAYTETRNGYGQDSMQTAQFPIVSVASLSVNGQAILARPALQAVQTGANPGTGYTFDETMLYLSGGTIGPNGYNWSFPLCFVKGYQNVQINYVAGYQITDEPATVPSMSPYQVATMTTWSAGDMGVKYASSGLALTKVTGIPTLGQYAEAAGLYTFSAADAGVAVLLSYAYVPFDVEQGVIETLANFFVARSRIGMKSMTIEQQTVVYDVSAMSSRAQGILQQYRRVAPIAP